MTLRDAILISGLIITITEIVTKRLLPFWEYVDTFVGDINTVVDTFSEVYDFYQLIIESNALSDQNN